MRVVERLLRNPVKLDGSLKVSERSNSVPLREHSPVPITSGEVLTRRQSFQRWLEARAYDIVQPNVAKKRAVDEACPAFHRWSHSLCLIPRAGHRREPPLDHSRGAANNARMTAEPVRQLLRKMPFVPVDLHLANGKVVPVSHPDFASMQPSGTP